MTLLSPTLCAAYPPRPTLSQVILQVLREEKDCKTKKGKGGAVSYGHTAGVKRLGDWMNVIKLQCILTLNHFLYFFDISFRFL